MGRKQRLLVGCLDGLYSVSSQDGGQTWSAPEIVLPNVEAMAMRADDGGTIYLGTRGEGLMRSADGGSTWEQVETPDDARKIISLSITPDRMLLGTEAVPAPAAVYEWTGGKNWKQLGDLMSAPNSEKWFYPVPVVGVHVRYVSQDPTKPERIYGAVQVGGVAISPDNGGTWYDKRNLDLDVHIVEPHPTQPGVIYSGAGAGGMYRSTDYGETWECISEGCGEFVIEFALDPADPARMYLGTGRGRVMTWGQPGGARGEMFRSDDAGQSWRKLDGNLPDQMESRINAVLVDPEDREQVYFGAGLPTEAKLGLVPKDGGVYHSPDGGTSWRRIMEHSDPVALFSVAGGRP